jgi:hypothetical protein
VSWQGSNPEKSLQLEKLRIVMDRDGIKRLEPCSTSVQTKRQRHMLPKLPGQHAAAS